MEETKEQTKKVIGIFTFCNNCKAITAWSVKCPCCGNRKDEDNQDSHEDKIS